ncbi:Imm45 family immunity protein [Actimicrobium sp. CCI2.3]|uniref:Imm45 family immunity protein n=1 Tax=Actimicrobium sp. CCI2.3 TaxID=3048616 RepID=UPI002AB571F6|nr:Imm45 family immunity protein [Actimicrobium sp. CCI2.3]MDY7575716.1 Imm45 family immunity protein [Actimicrobium sp. CCI2.3]MEB0024144.1 Imm45 family immunity protein [Actimicrobium sp. CCI2.3]
MNWIKLVDFEDEYLKIGTFLKFHPCDFFAGERVIEVIMCPSSSNYAAFEFFVTAGHESGKRLSFVPIVKVDKCDYLEKSWLLENWYRYIYPESNLSDVYVGRQSSIKKLPIKKGAL